MNCRSILVSTLCLVFCCLAHAQEGPMPRPVPARALAPIMGATMPKDNRPRLRKFNGEPFASALIRGEESWSVLLPGGETSLRAVDSSPLLEKYPNVPWSFEGRTEGPNVLLSNPKFPGAAEWEEDAATRFRRWDATLIEATNLQFGVLQGIMDRFVKKPDAPIPRSAVSNAYIHMCREDLVAAYFKLDKGNHGERNAVASLYFTAQSQQKAWYDRDDNYPPYVYEMIFQRSRSCVDIEPRGARLKPRGSGVLIGPNLVLTAKHVIDVDHPSDYEVEFDYEESWDFKNQQSVSLPSFKREIKSVVFAGEAPDVHSSPLDYVLLEIAPAAPGQERAPIPLSSERVTPETPIFLVGHPVQKPRQIHDNSWVKFPYKITEEEHNQLRLVLNAELNEEKVPDAAAETDRFDVFYQPQNKDFFYIDRTSGKANHVMGAECDTFRGDSGAPAMFRETGRIVGILTEGEADQGPGGPGRYKPNAYRAGWLHHEKILPINKVIDQLEEKLPGWQGKYQVKVDKD